MLTPAEKAEIQNRRAAAQKKWQKDPELRSELHATLHLRYVLHVANLDICNFAVFFPLCSSKEIGTAKGNCGGAIGKARCESRLAPTAARQYRERECENETRLGASLETARLEALARLASLSWRPAPKVGRCALCCLERSTALRAHHCTTFCAFAVCRMFFLLAQENR